MDEHVPDKAWKSDEKAEKKKHTHSEALNNVLSSLKQTYLQLYNWRKLEREIPKKKCNYSLGKQELSWHHRKCKNQSANSAVEISKLAYK